MQLQQQKPKSTTAVRLAHTVASTWSSFMLDLPPTMPAHTAQFVVENDQQPTTNRNQQPTYSTEINQQPTTNSQVRPQQNLTTNYSNNQTANPLPSNYVRPATTTTTATATATATTTATTTATATALPITYDHYKK